MTVLFALMGAYGICFGLMNDKASLVTDRVRAWTGEEGFFDRLLSCTYCTGFHAGWLAWLTLWAASDHVPNSPLGLDYQLLSPQALMTEMCLFAFASAAFCYLADTVAAGLEAFTTDGNS